MNKSRATAGIAVVFLAAALSLGVSPPFGEPVPYAGDPSLPAASDVFKPGDTKVAAQGNVEDMTY
ncbi:MAG: hypothetical protein ABI789_07075 [Usitatibacter sp.]